MEGKSYETGIKGEFFDDKLDASFSVFRIEQDKVAQTDEPNSKFVQQPMYTYCIEGVTSRGFEIDIQWSNYR
ncbi:MAG: TonB-dependent receptor domain-containing protein [Halarcobacter ebronensis]